jgi:hypothetical protein
MFEGNIMNKTLILFTCVFLVLRIVKAAAAGDDFYGIIESRPDIRVGTWTVGGRSIEVTERTNLDEDDGPLKIGACAEVDTGDGKVEEIETEPSHKFRK